MSNVGWIKLHRKLLDWEWFSDPECVQLFMYLLLSASYETNRINGITVKRGQVIVGTESLAKALNSTRQRIRLRLNKLQKSETIVCEATNRFTLVTICNYDDYQNIKDSEQPTDNQQNNQQNNQQKNEKTTSKRTSKKHHLNDYELDNYDELEIINNQQNNQQKNEKTTSKRTSKRTTTKEYIRSNKNNNSLSHAREEENFLLVENLSYDDLKRFNSEKIGKMKTNLNWLKDFSLGTKKRKEEILELLDEFLVHCCSGNHLLDDSDIYSYFRNWVYVKIENEKKNGNIKRNKGEDSSVGIDYSAYTRQRKV